LKPLSCQYRDRLSTQATVKAVHPDWLELQFAPPQRCAGCSGLCMWSFSSRPTIIRLPHRGQQVSIGDQLSLSISAPMLLKVAMFAYGLPLLCMLGGGLALGIGRSDGVAALGAGLGLIIGLPLAARLQRRLIGRLMAQLADPQPTSP
jgi:sigma-E factor negative regulatory protein RseC